MKKRALFSIGDPILLILIIFLQMHFSIGVSFLKFIRVFDYKLVLLLIYILIQVKLLLENSPKEYKKDNTNSQKHQYKYVQNPKKYTNLVKKWKKVCTKNYIYGTIYIV